MKFVILYSNFPPSQTRLSFIAFKHLRIMVKYIYTHTYVCVEINKCVYQHANKIIQQKLTDFLKMYYLNFFTSASKSEPAVCLQMDFNVKIRAVRICHAMILAIQFITPLHTPCNVYVVSRLLTCRTRTSMVEGICI